MSERLVNFLITYNSEDGYTLYTNTFNKCIVELPVFGARAVDAQDPTDPAAEYNRCVRFLTNGNYHIESFVVSAENMSEGVSIELQFSAHIIDWDNSYVIVGLEEIDYTYTFTSDSNIINIVTSEQIEDDVEIQIAYWEAAEFAENETYHIKITEETSESDIVQEEDVVCLLKEEVLYIGDYDAFMDIDEEPVNDYIYEVELTKNNYAYIAFDKAITDVGDGSYKYKVGFDEGEVEPQYLSEYVQYGKETILFDDINDHGITRTVERKVNYVGNLYIYDTTLEDTEEPFLITTEEATQFLPCLETSVISGEIYYVLNEETGIYDIIDFPEGNPAEQEYYRYVQVVDSDNILYVSSVGTYSVTLDNYNLIDVPQLVGSALLSMGRVDETTGKMEDHYGIGINSSDLTLSLPKKAISLFETEIVNDQVKYKYRGILGTLPQANQVDLTNSQVYSNYMEETQGIFTDNMYIGDASQYIAFYTDGEKNKHLKISAKDIVYDITSTGEEISWDTHIDDVAKQDIETEFDNRLKFFWQNLMPKEGYPAGTYMAGGPIEQGVTFNREDASTYGFNTFMDNTSLKFRLNDEVKTEIGKDGIVLGNPNDLHLEITKDRIAFLNGADIDPVSYIEQDKLYIPYSVVLNEMQMGENLETKEPLWAWKVMPDEHLRLVWLGTDTEESNE